MDKIEMEKLMDKYRAEMLEFSRRNNMSGYPDTLSNTNDAREKAMKDALDKSETFERDRSDPLPEISADDERDESAVPAQVRLPAEERPPVLSDESVDVAAVLRESCARLSPETSAEQRAKCNEINEFLNTNSERGTLRVEAFASDRAFGVGSARVMVFLELPSGNIAVFDGLTDIDGQSDTVILPAPPRSLSQSPQNGENPKLPYAVYSVYVEHPSYVRAVFSNVPVFSGVESIQPVRMLAKASGLPEPDPIEVDETSRVNLERRGN